MRRLRSSLIFAACLLCSFFCLLGGILHYDDSQMLRQNVTIYVPAGYCAEDMEVLKKAGQSLESQERMEYVVWGEHGKEQITDQEKYHSAQVQHLTIWGSSSILLAGGKSLSQNDREGCLLGSEASWQLFGSQNTIGLYVNWQGNTYQVRGILKESNLFVTNYDRTQSSILDHITVKGKEEEDIEDTYAKFQQRYQVAGERVPYEFSVFFPPFSRLFPGKWSDFSGWKENFQTYQEKKRMLESISKSTLEVGQLEKMRRAKYEFFFAVVFFLLLWYNRSTWWSVKMFRHYSAKMKAKREVSQHE